MVAHEPSALPNAQSSLEPWDRKRAGHQTGSTRSELDAAAPSATGGPAHAACLKLPKSCASKLMSQHMC